MTLSMLVPAGDDWIPRELYDLGRRLDALEGGYDLNSATIGEGGLTITGSGGLSVRTADDVEILRLGSMADDPRYNRPDGSRQLGFVVRRDDGSTALEVREGRADDGQYAQALAIRDRSGAVVLADDTNSGQGLARPWLVAGTWVDGYGIGVNTAPTDHVDWNVQQVADAYRQHPKATILVIVSSSSADTTGDVAVFDEDGAMMGTPLTVAPDSVAYARLDITWPPGWEFGSGGLFSLKARRTSGTGKVGARGISFIGRQS